MSLKIAILQLTNLIVNETIPFMNISKEASASHEISRNFDCIIVLGKNIGIDSTRERIAQDNFNLSTDSRISALAAGMLYKPGTKLIFSTGKTAGQDIPSEAEAMKNYMIRKFPDIPEEDCILEENSIDTAGNAEQVASVVGSYGMKRFRLVTVGYHLRNSLKLFERYGISISEGIASEQVIKSRSSHHSHYVDERWSKSKRVKKERRKETIRSVLLSTIDPRGKTLRQLTQRQRG